MIRAFKMTVASTLLAATSFAGSANSAVQAPAQTAYAADECITVNPGTPFCFQMCELPPRLRACDEE